MKNLYKN